MATLGLRLVGLHGLPASGKDTICDHLLSTFSNTQRIAFGDMLRNELSQEFDIKFDNMLARSKDTELSHVTWSWFPREIRERYGRPSKEYLTYRDLMRIYGTDYRRKQDVDYWLNKWRHEVNILPEGTCIVAPDVRFANECDLFMQHGVMLRVNSTIDVGVKPHPSDSLLPRYHFDINGRGLQDVHTTCQHAVEACKTQEFVLNDKIKELSIYATS